jgi:flagellar assembly factor FliW
MRYATSRFGTLQINTDAILLFPDGLVGFEQHQHFVLLSEVDNDAVGWLQSLSDPQFAVAVVTPHHFVSRYTLRLHRSQLSSLPWGPEDRSLVLAIVAQHEGRLTANLRAPVVINLDRCLGRQVITADDQPVRYPLPIQAERLRRTA